MSNAFACSECSKTFKHRTNLSRHSRKQHPIKPLTSSLSKPTSKCGECGQVLLSESALASHKSLFHSLSTSSDSASTLSSYIEAFRVFHSKAALSEKSISDVCNDVVFLINFAQSYGILSEPPTISSLFRNEGKLDALIQQIEVEYSGRGARGYALFLGLTKMLEYERLASPNTTEEEVLFARQERILDRARLPWARLRNRKTTIAHHAKNVSSSEKWLSAEDIKILSKDVTTQLDQLDALISTSPSDARR